MNKDGPLKAWIKPQLTRLGKIADVAGNQSGPCQGGGGNCQARS
jgi:hypothetical protein